MRLAATRGECFRYCHSMSRVSTAALVLLVACSHAKPKPPKDSLTVNLELSEHSTHDEQAIWFSYAMARQVFATLHEGVHPDVPGVVIPTFEEELFARGSALKVYAELRAKDPKVDIAYFNDLTRVAASSFLREYAWTYLHWATWGQPPADLKLAAFDEWRKTNLADHHVRTDAGIRYAVKPGSPQPPAAEPSKEYSMLAAGQQVASKGDHQRAIDNYANPVIQHYESSYQGALQRVYSAQNHAQYILYKGLPGPQPVEVSEGLWGDAYYLKAYSLEELKRWPEAQRTLETALALSPLNSQYLSELAYTWQALHDYDKALPLFAKAAAAAEQVRNEATNTRDLTRAWRGEAYCLVEQKKWDEAEAFYGKALQLDPHDQKSKSELEYIQRTKNATR